MSRVCLVIVCLISLVDCMKVLQTVRPLQKDSHAEYIPTTLISTWQQFTVCFKLKTFQFDSLDPGLGFASTLGFSELVAFGVASTKLTSKQIETYITSNYESIWRKGKIYAAVLSDEFELFDNVWKLNVWKSICLVKTENDTVEFYLDEIGRAHV